MHQSAALFVAKTYVSQCDQMWRNFAIRANYFYLANALKFNYRLSKNLATFYDEGRILIQEFVIILGKSSGHTGFVSFSKFGFNSILEVRFQRRKSFVALAPQLWSEGTFFQAPENQLQSIVCWELL